MTGRNWPPVEWDELDEFEAQVAALFFRRCNYAAGARDHAKEVSRLIRTRDDSRSNACRGAAAMPISGPRTTHSVGVSVRAVIARWREQVRP